MNEIKCYFNKDWDKAIETLQDRRKFYESQIAHLREENEKLKSERYKDEQLTSMKARLKRMESDYYRGFPISEKEAEAIGEWEHNHLKEKHPRALENPGYFGAIGGNFRYEFICTSIGTIGTIKCSCGDEFCFREMD